MTPTKTRPHKPMLAEWTSEVLSLSLSLPQRPMHPAQMAVCVGLLCQKSFPIMRRLFDALVLPTVLYGSEAWGPPCSPYLAA